MSDDQRTSRGHGNDESGPAASPGPEFVQAARLELDQLLEQLIQRARDVQATQGRLRGLLRANREIAAGVDLDAVLTHVLHAARTLVDARYAALGVVEDGRLTRFLHVGMDAATIATIGHLPEGKGLLGRLIDNPAPLRLTAISTDAASVGFPDGHPPMGSFLGVPIRTSRQIFGNLYLTDKQGADQFNADDQELVMALAAAAGIAIDNAALFAAAERRQRCHTAMQALSTAVLASDDPDEALAHVATHARDSTNADAATVCVPGDDPTTLRVAAADGIFSEHLGTTMPITDTIYAAALAAGTPLVIVDPAIDPRTVGQPAQHAGTIVAIPMNSGGLPPSGVLYLARSTDQPRFDDIDLDLLTTYGNHAALVLQLSAARRANAELRTVDDRKQVADDLQNQVVKDLFRLGLDLHAIHARVADSQIKAQLDARINDTDAIIRHVRDAAFDLHPHE